mmetsp:Transcript_107613/g.343450  ORF Transcript_107613/g.343450 Transcript_107613/m.343450 type:complete len:280 (+) Transcript_107613:415-1254(+)
MTIDSRAEGEPELVHVHALLCASRRECYPKPLHVIRQRLICDIGCPISSFGGESPRSLEHFAKSFCRTSRSLAASGRHQVRHQTEVCDTPAALLGDAASAAEASSTQLRCWLLSGSCDVLRRCCCRLSCLRCRGPTWHCCGGPLLLHEGQQRQTNMLGQGLQRMPSVVPGNCRDGDLQPSQRFPHRGCDSPRLRGSWRWRSCKFGSGCCCRVSVDSRPLGFGHHVLMHGQRQGPLQPRLTLTLCHPNDKGGKCDKALLPGQCCHHCRYFCCVRRCRCRC